MSEYKNKDTDQIARALHDYYEESRRDFYVIPREILEKWHNHLKILDEKAEAFDKLQQLEEEWADESMEYIDSVNEGFADYDEVVLSKLDGDFAYGRANVYDLVYLQLKDLER